MPTMTAGESIVVGNPSEGSRTRAIEYLEDGGVSVRNWDNGCRPSVGDLQALALDPGSALEIDTCGYVCTRFISSPNT